jgi:uncharacterized OB-fold protein
MNDVHQHGFVTPAIDSDSKPWWTALSEQRLLLPRCQVCGRAWFPATPGCPNCGANNYVLEEASGKGCLYSWVVIHRALSPVFADDVPYTIGLVELEEGPRVLARIVGPPIAGAPLRAVYYSVDGTTLLGFEAWT